MYHNTENTMHSLVVYRNLLQNKLIKKVLFLQFALKNVNNYSKAELQNCWSQICFELLQKAEDEDFSEELWKSYLLAEILNDVNYFSIRCERLGEKWSKDFLSLVIHDMLILKNYFEFDLSLLAEKLGLFPVEGIRFFNSKKIKNYYPQQYKENFSSLLSLIKEKPQEDELLSALISYYSTLGVGPLGKYAAFRWNKKLGLVGIKNPDIVDLDDIIGYEYQKELLINNTEAFIKDKKANNLLLVGARGTGKSSSIKALLKKYFIQGLRIIEFNKEQISELPKLMTQLRNRGCKFILFMDDLSFEDFEIEYKYLKAIIEGGLEAKPENLLIYATSNRRHLIKENRGENEIHPDDTVQEKLSLADRFGVTISFREPDQEHYLSIVKHLADKKGIIISEEKLEKQALQWEMWHNGRSGRTAEQFVNYLSSLEINGIHRY